jgi:hypothetical protein
MMPSSWSTRAIYFPPSAVCRVLAIFFVIGQENLPLKEEVKIRLERKSTENLRRITCISPTLNSQVRIVTNLKKEKNLLSEPGGTSANKEISENQLSLQHEPSREHLSLILNVSDRRCRRE